MKSKKLKLCLQPQPPSMARRKSSASPELVDDKASGISKHQMKKQAKQRKRVRRYCGHKTSAASSGDGGMPQALDSHSDKGQYQVLQNHHNVSVARIITDVKGHFLK